MYSTLFESVHVKWSQTRAGTVSDSSSNMDVQAHYYDQTGQIGVGPRTNFQQIGTFDMEWLI